MTISTASVPTASASRYLQQLCKHWSHKFAVTYDAHQGTIPLPMGTATLTAHESTLEVQVDVADSANLERMQKVVAEHLDRFAFREAPLPFNWS
jgi:hypothetical protein